MLFLRGNHSHQPCMICQWLNKVQQCWLFMFTHIDPSSLVLTQCRWALVRSGRDEHIYILRKLQSVIEEIHLLYLLILVSIDPEENSITRTFKIICGSVETWWTNSELTLCKNNNHIMKCDSSGSADLKVKFCEKETEKFSTRKRS